MVYLKLLLLVVIVALLTPLTTSIMDCLCWFYSSSTCTGLIYDGFRIGVMGIATISSFMLMIFLMG